MAKQISPKEATDLCNNFDTRYVELCKLIKKDDNRSVLFSLEELKSYINYLEKSDSNINGIRVYFAAYNEKEGGLATVFLAPTENGKDNKILNLFNIGEAGNPPKKKYGK